MCSSALCNEDLLNLVAKGDTKAKEMLISQNTGLVHSVVNRFLGRGHEREDLFQIGCIGLIKAVEKFDTSYNVKFSTYAVPMIMGEIKRFIRDDGIIKVSRSLKETASKAMSIKEELMNKNGTEPKLNEIAEIMNISPSELSMAFEAGVKPESLYATVEGKDRENKPLIERLEEGKDYEENIVNRIAVRRLIEELDEREQKIICLRYFKQQTQAKIADILGISQVQVSRIEKKLLSRLRQELAE